MKKVIFVDIDGVLVTMSSLCGGYERGLNTQTLREFGDARCIDNLKALVATTGASIVVSSAWRHMGFTTIQRFFNEVGLEIVACTDTIEDGRGFEILRFVEQNRLSRWLAIDDDVHDMGCIPWDNLVQTSFQDGLNLAKLMEAATKWNNLSVIPSKVVWSPARVEYPYKECFV